MGVRARAASSKWTVSSVPAWFRADSGTNLIKQGEIVTGRPCGSVAQWSECSPGVRGSWVRVRVGLCLYFSPVIYGDSVWVRARAASSKETVSSVPAWFRADSGTNLIKREEIVTGRLCGSVAQWSECSHGMREVLGSSPGRAMCFFLPCDIYCHGSTGWLGSSVVRVLAWCARGHGFESRSGHVLFPPICDIWWPEWGSVLGLRAAKGLSRRFRHGSDQIQGESN